MTPDLEAYLTEVGKVTEAAELAFGVVTDPADLVDLYEEYFARKGRLIRLRDGLTEFNVSDKIEACIRFVESRNQIDAAYQAAKRRLS